MTMRKMRLGSAHHAVRSKSILDDPVFIMLDNLVLKLLFGHRSQPRNGDAQLKGAVESKSANDNNHRTKTHALI